MNNKCQGGSQRGWRTEGEGRATASSQIGLRLIAAGKIFFFWNFLSLKFFLFFTFLPLVSPYRPSFSPPLWHCYINSLPEYKGPFLPPKVRLSLSSSYTSLFLVVLIDFSVFGFLFLYGFSLHRRDSETKRSASCFYPCSVRSEPLNPSPFLPANPRFPCPYRFPSEKSFSCYS
jgi:hypothetical protein